MEDQGEDEELFDSESEDNISFDDAEEDDDPKGDAFLRGVEEAVKIKEETEEEEQT